MPTDPTPTPPPERADTVDELRSTAAAMDGGQNTQETADLLRAAAAELERLREEMKDLREDNSAWEAESARVSADIARLRAENNRLRAENKNARERLVEQECQLDDLRLTLAESEETVVASSWWVLRDGRLHQVVGDDLPSDAKAIRTRFDAAPVRALFATREVRGEVER